MIKMVVSDLDGTLLDSNSKVSRMNYIALKGLGEKGIIRTIATGRSPYSAYSVLPSDFPIDYLIFSSGAGIIEWRTKSIIYSKELPSNCVLTLINILIDNNVDFMIQDQIPQNHYFYYHSAGNNNPDFDRRISHYEGFCQPLIMGEVEQIKSTQIVAIMPNDVDYFNSLSAKISNANIIRSTSPLDGDSIWMEIFAQGVSKGSGINHLCHRLGGISPNEIVVTGNDYNDIDMLELTPNAFVVENSPNDLKLRFNVIPSNYNDGFAWLVGQINNNSIINLKNIIYLKY